MNLRKMLHEQPPLCAKCNENLSIVYNILNDWDWSKKTKDTICTCSDRDPTYIIKIAKPYLIFMLISMKDDLGIYLNDEAFQQVYNRYVTKSDTWKCLILLSVQEYIIIKDIIRMYDLRHIYKEI